MYILRPGIDRCPCCGSIIPEGVKRGNLLVMTMFRNSLDAEAGIISKAEATTRNLAILAEIESEK